MRFNEDKLAAVARYLDEKWPMPRTCPVCRRNPEHWRVSETPVLLPLLTGGADISIHSFEQAAERLSVAPVVAVTCSDCGHILFFNAAPMGVAPATGGVGGRFSIPSA